MTFAIGNIGINSRSHWRLTIQGTGFLQFVDENGEPVFDAAVFNRYARYLKVLKEAELADELSRAPTAGWRTRAQIGDAMGRDHGWPLPAESISNYAAKLQSDLRKLWAQKYPDLKLPPLIERSRGRGMRLAPAGDLEIVYVDDSVAPAPIEPLPVVVNRRPEPEPIPSWR